MGHHLYPALDKGLHLHLLEDQAAYREDRGEEVLLHLVQDEVDLHRLAWVPEALGHRVGREEWADPVVQEDRED
jgi:hypothetical protein